MTGMLKRVWIAPLKMERSASSPAPQRNASAGKYGLQHDAAEPRSAKSVAVGATTSGLIDGMSSTGSVYVPLKGKKHKPALKGALEGVRRSSDRTFRRLYGAG